MMSRALSRGRRLSLWRRQVRTSLFRNYMTLRRRLGRSRQRRRSICRHWTQSMKSLSIEKTRKRTITSQVNQAKRVQETKVVQETYLRSQVQRLSKRPKYHFRSLGKKSRRLDSLLKKTYTDFSANQLSSETSQPSAELRQTLTLTKKVKSSRSILSSMLSHLRSSQRSCRSIMTSISHFKRVS